MQLDSNSASHVFTLKSSVFCEGVTQFEPQNKAGAIEIRPRKFNSFPHFLYLKSVVLLDSKVNKEKLDESDRNQTGSEQHVPVVFVIEQRELIANTLKNNNSTRTGRENGQQGRWSPWKTLGKVYRHFSRTIFMQNRHFCEQPFQMSTTFLWVTVLSHLFANQ